MPIRKRPASLVLLAGLCAASNAYVCLPAHAQVIQSVMQAGPSYDNFNSRVNLTAVNASGDAVGSVSNYSTGTTTAFLARNGAYTFLTPPNLSGQNSSATALNDKGQVTLYVYGNGNGDAYLYANGQYTNVGGFGSDATGHVGSLNPLALNNNGDVAGIGVRYDSNHQSSGNVAFLYHNGQLTDIGSLGTDAQGQSFAGANALNNKGDIVGASAVFDASHVYTGSAAFLAHNGQRTNLGSLGTNAQGQTSASATHINDQGIVTGYGSVYDSAHNYVGQQGFVYQNGQLLRVDGTGTDYSGDHNSTISAANASGAVVGFTTDANFNIYTDLDSSFLFQNGQFTPLYGPGTTYGNYKSVDAVAINDEGWIGGTEYAYDDYGSYAGSTAWVNIGGTVYDLNFLAASLPAAAGWNFNDVLGLNDAGFIWGEGSYNGQFANYVLSLSGASVPEPGAWACGLALLVCGVSLVRRRRAA